MLVPGCGGTSFFIPWTSILSCPLHVQSSFGHGCLTNCVVPWTLIFSQPFQHLHVSLVSGVQASLIIPWTSILCCPFQHLKMSSSLCFMISTQKKKKEKQMEVVTFFIFLFNTSQVLLIPYQERFMSSNRLTTACASAKSF